MSLPRQPFLEDQGWSSGGYTLFGRQLGQRECVEKGVLTFSRSSTNWFSGTDILPIDDGVRDLENDTENDTYAGEAIR
jgi:hypothetical protein